MRVLLLLFITYFLLFEILQFVMTGWKYLHKITNYVDVLPLLLNLYSIWLVNSDGFRLDYKFYVI